MLLQKKWNKTLPFRLATIYLLSQFYFYSFQAVINSLKQWWSKNSNSNQIITTPATGHHLDHPGVSMLLTMESFVANGFRQSSIISQAGTSTTLNPTLSIMHMKMYSMELSQVIILQRFIQQTNHLFISLLLIIYRLLVVRSLISCISRGTLVTPHA